MKDTFSDGKFVSQRYRISRLTPEERIHREASGMPKGKSWPEARASVKVEEDQARSDRGCSRKLVRALAKFELR